MIIPPQKIIKMVIITGQYCPVRCRMSMPLILLTGQYCPVSLAFSGSQILHTFFPDCAEFLSPNSLWYNKLAVSKRASVQLP
jgi:hypothetical protein